MKKKKILFIYRYAALHKIILGEGRFAGPCEFLWGMNHVNADHFEIRSVNAPREEKRIGIRRWLWFIEFPFAKLVRIGLPLEIYPLFKKEIEWADEIVCVNDQISLGVLFWKLLGKLKHPKIHCIIMSLPERIKYFRWCRPIVWFISRLLNVADTVIILSDVVKKDFVENYVLKTNIYRMYFGIDTDFWYPVPQEKKESFILSVGNDMNRDYQTLVDALPHDIQLKLVTKKKIDIHDKNNIEILSDISNEELRLLYTKAFLVVVPSIQLKNESSGLSCSLQAMACKTPVIISKAAPLQEMFKDERDCLFYEPENSQDLEKKIRLLLEHKELRDTISENGFINATKNYSSKNMGKDLEYILGDL